MNPRILIARHRPAFLIVAAGMLLAATLAGCRKDLNFDKVKPLTWKPDLALPLVHDSITLRKILTQSGTEDHLYIDESGNISILYYYNNDAFRIRPNDLAKVSPVSFDYYHQITPAEETIIRNGDLTLAPVPYSLTLVGTNNGLRIDKMQVKKGTIRITTDHSFYNGGFLTVRFPDATLAGNPWSFSLGPVREGIADTTVSLAGVIFNLAGSPNTIRVTVEGLLRQSSSVNASDQLNGTFTVTVDTFGLFEGYLGKWTLDGLQDTVRVSVFNNAYTLGDLYFIDPQATITFVNSIGIPADVVVEKMVAINDATGATLDVASRLGAGAFIQVPSPAYPLTAAVVQSVTYTNANTGNAMYDFFNMKPDNVAFQVKTVINPTGTPFNFFTDTCSLRADLRVKLPLWGHFDHLTYQDTFDLVIDRPEEIEFLELKTHIVNGMPMYALLQVYLTDDQYHIKDSLAGDDLIFIREAPVDPSTFLPYPGQYGIKDTTYVIDSQRMTNLDNVTRMLVKGVLFTPDEGTTDVRLRADQSIRLHFAAHAKLKKTIEPWND